MSTTLLTPIIEHLPIVILIGWLSSLTLFTLSMSFYVRWKKIHPISRRRLGILTISALVIIFASELAFRSSEELLIIFLLVFTPFALYEFSITCRLCGLSRDGKNFMRFGIFVGGIIIALIPITTIIIKEGSHQKAVDSVNSDFEFYLVAAAAARTGVEEKMDSIATNEELIDAILREDAELAYEITKNEKETSTLDLLVVRTNNLPIIDTTSELGTTNANITNGLEYGKAHLIQWGAQPFTIISAQKIVDSDGVIIGSAYGGTIVDQERSRAFAALLDGSLSLLRPEGAFYYSGELEETEAILNHTPMATLCANTEEALWIDDINAYIRVLPMVRYNLPEDCLTYGVSVIISPNVEHTTETAILISLISSGLLLTALAIFYRMQEYASTKYLSPISTSTKQK